MLSARGTRSLRRDLDSLVEGRVGYRPEREDPEPVKKRAPYKHGRVKEQATHIRPTIAVALLPIIVAVACTGTGDDASAGSGSSAAGSSVDTTDAPLIAAVGDLVCAFGTRDFV